MEYVKLYWSSITEVSPVFASYETIDTIASLSVNNFSGGVGLLAFSAIWMIVCYVYVKIAHKDAMEESNHMVKDLGGYKE